MVDSTINSGDLNAIDFLNGQGNIASKGNVYGLKGSLSKQGMGVYATQPWIFMHGELEKYLQYELERFEYLGLPEELNKYQLEVKMLLSGSVALVKIEGKLYVCNYTQTNFNIYNEPTQILLNEPKSEFLHSKKFNINTDDVVIIRNNISKSSTRTFIYRYLICMEKIIFQLEKNVLRSAPKGLINTKGGNIRSVADEPTDNSTKNSLERFINGQDTIGVVDLGDQINQVKQGMNEESIFTAIDFEDKGCVLIEQYQFFKEQVKELVGCGMNIHEKAERVQNDEIQSQQDFSISSLQHAFNIRKIDIENVNKKFKTNISIQQIPDEREEQKGEDTNDLTE